MNPLALLAVAVVSSCIGFATAALLASRRHDELAAEIVRLNTEPKPGDVYTYPASAPRVIR